MPEPQISVVMSVYNGESYLAEAIDSILAQSFTDFELIVINDASIDGTAAVLSGYDDPRIRIVTNSENSGLTVNLNRGIALARAPLIARHDADDRSHPDRFRLQLDFLARHPDIAVLGTQFRLIYPDGRLQPAPAARARLRTPDGVRWQAILDSPFVHSSIMMRAETIRSLGGYNETFRAAQDYELWSRLLCEHKGANLSEPLVDFRIHAQSVSHKYTSAQIGKKKGVSCTNILRHLDTEPRWFDDWIWVDNPALWHAGRCENPVWLAQGILVLRDRFLAKVPEPAAVKEIQRHVARLIERVATNLALNGDGRAFGCLPMLFRANPGIALTILPGLLWRWARFKLR